MIKFKCLSQKKPKFVKTCLWNPPPFLRVWGSQIYLNNPMVRPKSQVTSTSIRDFSSTISKLFITTGKLATLYAVDKYPNTKPVFLDLSVNLLPNPACSPQVKAFKEAFNTKAEIMCLCITAELTKTAKITPNIDMIRVAVSRLVFEWMISYSEFNNFGPAPKFGHFWGFSKMDKSKIGKGPPAWLTRMG